MSKESRRRQRAASQGSGSGSSGAPTTGSTSTRPPAGTTTSSPARSSSPTGATRAGRRDRSRHVRQQSFTERYRSAILAVAVVAGVALIGAFVFVSASQPAFACSTIWEPTPTPAPAEGASPEPGYVQPDMGTGHVPIGTQVTYTYCPPASGRHFNSPPSGPIVSRVYGPGDTVIPQGWVHNLEHGGIVILYRGDSDGATDAGQAAMQAMFDDFPPSPVCGFQPGGQSPGPVFARFDEMATPFAALVWGRVLPLQELDQEAILEFYSIWGERTNPERLCAVPTPAPSVDPSESAAPSPSAS